MKSPVLGAMQEQVRKGQKISEDGKTVYRGRRAGRQMSISAPSPQSQETPAPVLRGNAQGPCNEETGIWGMQPSRAE